MDLDSGQFLDEFESYVKLPNVEDYKIDPGAFKVHGITAEKCFKEGNSPEFIRDKLLDMWVSSGTSLIANHNISFDIDWLCEHIFHCDKTQFNKLFTHRYLDSLPVMRLFEGHNQVVAGASLEKSAQSLNIEIKNKAKLHGALFDAKLCGLILHKFRKLLMSLDIK